MNERISHYIKDYNVYLFKKFTFRLIYNQSALTRSNFPAFCPLKLSFRSYHIQEYHKLISYTYTICDWGTMLLICLISIPMTSKLRM